MTWNRVDGGVFPGSQVVGDVAIIDANHIAVVTQNGHTGYSSDGGATWVNSGVPLAGVTSCDSCRYAVGVILTLCEVVGGRKLARSVDNGHTWSDVTPAAFTGSTDLLNQPQYSTSLSLWLMFSSLVGAPPSTVYTSPDGITWTEVDFSNGDDTLYNFLILGADIVDVAGACVVVGTAGVGVTSFGTILRSTDGTTWDVVLSEVSGLAVFHSIVKVGGVLNAVGSEGPDNATQWNYASTDNGVTWTEKTNPSSSSHPWATTQAFVGSKFITGFDPDTFQSVSNSTDVTNWTIAPISQAAFTLSSDGTTAYAYGGNDILASTDAVTWDEELTFESSGFIQQIRIGSGITIAVGIGDGDGGIWLRNGSGPVLIAVPDVVGDTLSTAGTVVTAATLVVGTLTPVYNPSVPFGSVVSQSPIAGTMVLAGTPVSLTISAPAEAGFDVFATVISQYANSPTLLQLVQNIETYLDQTINFAQFYAYIWNVATAVGFGLDIWGKIVGVGRTILVEGTVTILGDDDYRTLVLTKALANILATTAPSFNQLLSNLFPGQRCYVTDLGNMQMGVVFEFLLTPVQLAIVTQSGVFPH